MDTIALATFHMRRLAFRRVCAGIYSIFIDCEKVGEILHCPRRTGPRGGVRVRWRMIVHEPAIKAESGWYKSLAQAKSHVRVGLSVARRRARKVLEARECPPTEPARLRP